MFTRIALENMIGPITYGFSNINPAWSGFPYNCSRCMPGVRTPTLRPDVYSKPTLISRLRPTLRPLPLSFTCFLASTSRSSHPISHSLSTSTYFSSSRLPYIIMQETLALHDASESGLSREVLRLPPTFLKTSTPAVTRVDSATASTVSGSQIVCSVQSGDR